ALPAFGTVPPNGVGVTSADDLNPANISVLAHHERLFALWEAGSPHELDPDTLETRGVTEFSDDAAGLPFSAHPKVEADGTLWNFGYSGGELLVLWHLDSTGRVKRLKPLRIENVGMPHDFVVTERYLVFLLAPLHRDPDADLETASFLDLHRWYPDRATRVVIVRKSDLELEQVVELPAQWVFHFGNAYDDGRGIVRFDAARSPSPEILTQCFRSVMAGHWHVPPAVRWTEYRVDLNARRADESLLLDDLECEFPRIDPRQVARHHDHVWMLAGTPGQASPGGLNQVLRIDRRSDTVDRYVYGPEYMVEEHTVVTPTASKQRFLLGTALNLEQRRTELHLFDADALAAGPRARAVLPYAMPLGFHGTYRESPRA
ncbi:MAG: carotenoid oxygenase family protein, partial [Pseudomonadota bacterium]